MPHLGYPSLHPIPPVGVEIEGKGLSEEQKDVENHRRTKDSRHFVHDFGIAPDKHEYQHTAHQRSGRERPHAELYELLRHLVIIVCPSSSCQQIQ